MEQGITLPLAQYSTFVTLLPSIEAALVAKGESVARPDYSATKPSKTPDGVTSEDGDAENQVDGDRTKKENFEATSDEDE